MQVDKPSGADPEEYPEEEGHMPDPSEENERKEEENVQDEGTKEEIESLSLSELNDLAGRRDGQKFKSKDDFFTHYKNLNSFVGKQGEKGMKKESKENRMESDETVEELRSRLMSLEGSIEKDKFLSSNPLAKENLDILEAYAEKNGKSLSEAWEEKKSVFIHDDRGEVGIKSVNRVAPVRSEKERAELEIRARSGDLSAQRALIKTLEL